MLPEDARLCDLWLTDGSSPRYIQAIIREFSTHLTNHKSLILATSIRSHGKSWPNLPCLWVNHGQKVDDEGRISGGLN